MTLVEQISNGIKDAMKSRDQVRLNVLRMLKSKILAVDARGNLPDADVVKLFKTYLGNLQEALEMSKDRPETVANLKSEIVIVEEFIPKALSTDETKKLVAQAIVDSGAKSKKDLGSVMKIIKSLSLTTPIDGKLAKELADQLLGD